ncbi:MAG: LysM domain-containing protein [Dehalococcoidia bacterium]
MPPRNLVRYALPLLVPALLVLAACGGDDDDSTFQPGKLTDPEGVPTASPWTAPPEVVILDPENIQPLPPDNPGGPAGSPTATPVAGEPGVCGETYTVEAGDILVDIGTKCGVDWELIAELNPDVNPAALTVGQVLIMPPAEGESESQ